MTVLSLTRQLPRVPAMGAGAGAPKPYTAEGARQRQELGEFLVGRLMVPQDKVEGELDELTIRERVWLELEMRQNAPVLHSADYDPFANGGR